MLKSQVKLHEQRSNYVVEFAHENGTDWIPFSQRYLAEHAVQAIELLIADTEAATVRTFVDRWIEHHVLCHVNSGSVGTYVRYATEAIHFFGDKSLHDVTTKDIAKSIQAMRAQGMKDRQITPILIIWSSMFGTAVKWRYISCNPVSGIDGLLLGDRFPLRDEDRRRMQ